MFLCALKVQINVRDISFSKYTCNILIFCSRSTTRILMFPFARKYVIFMDEKITLNLQQVNEAFTASTVY